MWPISGETGRKFKDWSGQRTRGGWKKEGWPAWWSWWVSCPVSTHLVPHDPGITWAGSLAGPLSDPTCNHRSLTAMFWHKSSMAGLFVWRAWSRPVVSRVSDPAMLNSIYCRPQMGKAKKLSGRVLPACDSLPFLLQCRKMQCQPRHGGTVGL